MKRLVTAFGLSLAYAASTRCNPIHHLCQKFPHPLRDKYLK